VGVDPGYVRRLTPRVLIGSCSPFPQKRPDEVLHHVLTNSAPTGTGHRYLAADPVHGRAGDRDVTNFSVPFRGSAQRACLSFLSRRQRQDPDRLDDGDLEQAINGVPNMRYMMSDATSAGEGTIQIIFEPGTDPNVAVMNVNNRVQMVKNNLPPIVEREGIIVMQNMTSMLMYLNVFSTIPRSIRTFCTTMPPSTC
jgi:hypothetical protein